MLKDYDHKFTGKILHSSHRFRPLLWKLHLALALSVCSSKNTHIKENIDRAQSSLIAISSLLFLKPLSIIIRLSDLRIISIVSKCQVINFACSFSDDPKISFVICHIKFYLLPCFIIILVNINRTWNNIGIYDIWLYLRHILLDDR